MRLAGAVCALLALAMLAHADDRRVLLRDIPALHFAAGKMSTSFRHPARPQMAPGSNFTAVACANTWDTIDGEVVWTCHFSHPDGVLTRKGRFNIACEGYDHDADPYILAGSCGIACHLPVERARIFTLTDELIFITISICLIVFVNAFFSCCCTYIHGTRDHRAPAPSVDVAPASPTEADLRRKWLRDVVRRHRARRLK